MRSRTRSTLVLFLLALASISGCSSSQTSGGDGIDQIEAGTESGADAVGSIPEDMLANEESTGPTTDDMTTADPSVNEPDANATVESESTPQAADPFSDLADSTQVDDEEKSETTGETATYTVKAGDTLMKIAFQIYGDLDRWKDLRDWNQGKVKGLSNLKVGTRLTYETPSEAFSPEERAHTYVIKQGDTLAGIADEVYGRKMKFRKLQNYNKSLIKNADRIFAGFTIFYDITQQEMAEAEARRQERMAGGGMSSGTSANPDGEMSLIPSAIQPAGEPAAPAPMAVSPGSSGPIPPPGSSEPVAPPPSPTSMAQ